MRYAVAFALGGIGDGRAVPHLAKLLTDDTPVIQPLNDNHTQVCHAAEEALNQIGTPQAKKILDQPTP